MNMQLQMNIPDQFWHKNHLFFFFYVGLHDEKSLDEKKKHIS